MREIGPAAQSLLERPLRYPMKFAFSLRRSGGSLFVLLFAMVCLGAAHAQILSGSGSGLSREPLAGAGIGTQDPGEAATIAASGDRARLHCEYQKMDGEASSEGLWLTSTSAESRGDRFRVEATALGRGDAPGSPLPTTGVVSATGSQARWERPNLTEEYSASMDGVRQDFLVAERPEGTGALRLELAVAGAQVEASTYGVQLTLGGSHRAVAYSRLKVVDAAGKAVSARFEILAADRLAVRVEDLGAEYPLRIDPTFSDVNWTSFGGLAGASADVTALAVDAHSGLVYMAGGFRLIGNGLTNFIAVWNGSVWSTLSGGLNGAVSALALDGSGNLYAGGSFTSPGNNIAKWNGSAWSGLGVGLNSAVLALAVDGSGNVYAGGVFTGTQGGGVTASYVAKWTGSTWTALGSGTNNVVWALTLDRSGNLYAGGDFSSAGGAAASYIAKWNGSAWSALGSGMDRQVLALAVDASGNLLAGGSFTKAGGLTANAIAKWNGSAWSPVGVVGGAVASLIRALTIDGAGNVYAGGDFAAMDGTPTKNVAKWDGSQWTAFGSGISGSVSALAVDGGGNLYAGGFFDFAGGVLANNVARWNGSAWSALYTPPVMGLSGLVNALARDGAGNLYAAGHFNTAGGAPVGNVAKWDGTTWSALGSGTDGQVYALTLDSLGNLYAGGQFTTAGGITVHDVAKWDGHAWSAMNFGVSGIVYALTADGAGNVYVGGDFIAASSIPAAYIAKWNGSAWSQLQYGMNNVVSALAMDHAGNLYAGGRFTTANQISANYLAKWNGSAWSALDSGTNSQVSALTVDGSDNLYAVGNFASAGGITVNYVAKWNGGQWSALGSGSPFGGQALAADASGNLFVGGYFTTAGAGSANRIAKWDGAAWSALGSGLDDAVNALILDGSGHLFVGGQFTSAGAHPTAYIAEAAVGAPTASSLAAANVTTTGATLNGTINANGYTTAVSFDYGVNASYGSTVAASPTPATGNVTMAESAVLTGLTPNTTYHFRINAVNSVGPAYGNDQTFLTLPTTPLSLTYSLNPAIYTLATPIANNLPTTTGSPALYYSVSPPLPAGLVLNTTTGVISGTPAVPFSATDFTVSASNDVGAATTKLNISVKAGSANAQLFVANLGISTVGDYNPANGVAINAGITTGLSTPAGLVLLGNNLLVSNLYTNAVGVYDASAGSVGNTAFIPGLSNPHGMALAGDTLFVTNTDGNSVGAYHASTGAVINASLITGLNGPNGVALSGDTLYVTNRLGNTVGVYDATTGAAINTSFITGLNGPTGVALSGSTLLVANYAGNTVGAYDAASGTVINASFITGLNGPYGLVVSGSSLYIANYGSGKVGVYNPATGAVVNSSLISNLHQPTYLALLPALAAPTSLFYVNNPASYTKGVAITPYIPATSGGAITVYSVSPALPAGITLNASTGAIGGTPTVLSPAATYVVFGANRSGIRQIPVTITVNDAAPSALTYSANPAVYTALLPISANVPQSSGGAVVSYTVSPALPTGLHLDQNTGILMGTPAVTAAATAYTITATNTGGSTTANVNIAVISQMDVWRQRFFGTTSNTGDSADAADPYHTGVSNLLAFAFLGSDQDPSQAALSQLPQLQMTGGNLCYSFTQPAGVSGITYGAEWTDSVDSGSWTPISDTGSGNLHTFVAPIGDNTQMFIRLTVNTP